MMEFLFTLLLQAKTNFNNFCERHLVAADPAPYAEDGVVDLVNEYMLTKDERLWLELRFRVQQGMVTEARVHALILQWNRGKI